MRLILKTFGRLLTAAGWLSFQILKQAVQVAHEQLELIEPGTPVLVALPPADKTVTVETTTVLLSPVEREMVTVAEQAAVAVMVEPQTRNQRALIVTSCPTTRDCGDKSVCSVGITSFWLCSTNDCTDPYTCANIHSG